MDITDNFLTLDQAKELQKLGVDFSNANYCFRTVDFNNNPSWKYIKDKGEDDIHIFIDLYKFRKDSDIICIKTFSVAEMMEMLPKCIEVKDVLYELYFKKSSFYINEIAYELGYREYLNESLSINEFTHTLLRDALFEMLKWLKQNKMI